MKNLWMALCALLLGATVASRQITVPNTLASGNVIYASQLNTNFSALALNSLNRITGGNIEGNVTVAADITIDGADISDYLASNKITFPVNGTAEAPAVLFKNDTDTGFYLIEAGKLGVTVNGTKIARFEATGTVLQDVTVEGTFTTDSFVVINRGAMVYGQVIATLGFGGDLSGNAGTVTNGVYTVGNQTIEGVKTFTDKIVLNTTDDDTYLATGLSAEFQVFVDGVVRTSVDANGDLINYGNADLRGTLLVGGASANPAYTLNVKGRTSDGLGFGIVHTNSSDVDVFYVTNDAYGYLNAAAWHYVSDITVKKNIRPLTTGRAVVLALNPVKFDYTTGAANQYGFIAQEVQTVLPEAVTASPKDGKLALATDFIVPFLVKTIQEQDAQIQALEARISALEARIP
jgi:hypothetical protein